MLQRGLAPTPHGSRSRDDAGVGSPRTRRTRTSAGVCSDTERGALMQRRRYFRISNEVLPPPRGEPTWLRAVGPRPRARRGLARAAPGPAAAGGGPRLLVGHHGADFDGGADLHGVLLRRARPVRPTIGLVGGLAFEGVVTGGGPGGGRCEDRRGYSWLTDLERRAARSVRPPSAGARRALVASDLAASGLEVPMRRSRFGLAGDGRLPDLGRAPRARAGQLARLRAAGGAGDQRRGYPEEGHLRHARS